MNIYEQAYNRIVDNVKGIKQKHRAIARKYKRIEEDMGILGQGINFGEFGDGGDIPFVPSGSPKAWYSADSITGKSNGDSITSWTDLTGNGHHLLENIAAGQAPLYKTGILNGKPAVHFRSTNDILETAACTLTQPNTYFVVFQWLDPTADVLQTLFDPPNGARQICSLWGGNPRTWSMYAGAFVNSAVAGVGTPECMTFSFNGASSFARLNATEIFSGDPSAGGVTQFAVGRGGGSTGLMYVHEIVIYDSDESFTDNETGLKAKWGV